MTRSKDWLIRTSQTICLAIFVFPFLMFLAYVIMSDTSSDHGAVVFKFVSGQADDVWLVGLNLGAEPVHRESVSEREHLIDSATRRGTKSVDIVSAPAGRHAVTIRYRIGNDGAERLFRFDVDLVAESQCKVTISFLADGPQAGRCINPRPASYGGTWPH